MMKEGLFVFWMLVAVSFASYAQMQEEKLVRNAFDDYKNAVMTDKGAAAVNYVDSGTIRYYSNMLELARHADSFAIEKLGVFDKFMVLAIRQRTSKESIISLDGKGLLQYAIESGMVGKNSVANNSIGEVSIDNLSANGQLIANEETTDFYFHFNKEFNRWKIDLTSVFDISTKAIQSMINQSGQSENEYIFSLLEMVTGKKPGREIWLPVE